MKSCGSSQIGKHMLQASDMTQSVQARITQVIEKLQQSHPVFQELDRSQLADEYTSSFLQQWQPQQVLDFSEAELTDVIQDFMALDNMAGLLNDLTPEQVQQFDEAVKRG